MQSEQDIGLIGLNCNKGISLKIRRTNSPSLPKYNSYNAYLHLHRDFINEHILLERMSPHKFG